MTDQWTRFDEARKLLRSKKRETAEQGWALAAELISTFPPDSPFIGDLVLLATKQDIDRGLALALRRLNPDTSARLALAAKLLKLAGEKAVPIVLEGLLAKWDKNVEYDMITQQKYVLRTFKLLEGYDLKPYLARIEAGFAKVKDKKVLAAVESGLAPHRGKRAVKKRQRVEKPAWTYALDTYAAAIGREVVELLAARDDLPPRIASIKLQRMPETIRVMGVTVSGKSEGDAKTFELIGPKTTIPLDFEDRRLARLFAEHGFSPRDEQLPSWGDDFQRPGCAYVHELLEALRSVAAALRKQGLKVDKAVRLGAFEWSTDDGWPELIAQALEVTGGDEVLTHELASALYATPARQQWLTSLS